MTVRYEQATAAAVVGLAGFQLLSAWNTNAPTLSDMRKHDPSDIQPRQHLMDADFMVGGLAVVLGTAFAVLTKDFTALVVMLVIYGLLSMWWHLVLDAQSV